MQKYRMTLECWSDSLSSSTSLSAKVKHSGSKRFTATSRLSNFPLKRNQHPFKKNFVMSNRLDACPQFLTQVKCLLTKNNLCYTVNSFGRNLTCKQLFLHSHDLTHVLDYKRSCQLGNDLLGQLKIESISFFWNSKCISHPLIEHLQPVHKFRLF